MHFAYPHKNDQSANVVKETNKNISQFLPADALQCRSEHIIIIQMATKP